MKNKAPIPVNSDILIWARETAGYSLAKIAETKNFNNIDAWENGEAYPTYSQLEALADKYKRPIAIFFFPSPPEEITVEKSLRAVSEEDVRNLSPQIRFLFRKARVFQIYLRELFSDTSKEQSNKLSWLKNSIQKNPSVLARNVRAIFNITAEYQSSWENVDQALEGWRTILAQHGIYVFKDAFKDNRVSGFCIYDDLFPIIYVNNSHSKSRQIFTIFHELAHLLFKENYLDVLDDYESSSIEAKCNAFAGHFLVPDEDFKDRFKTDYYGTDEIEKIADFYKVSREVVLRKLFSHKLIDKPYYEKMTREWKNSFDKKIKSSNGGGNYFYTRLAYLGKPYFSVIFERYYQGRISIERAAEYLDIKAKSFSDLDEYFRRGLSDVRV